MLFAKLAVTRTITIGLFLLPFAGCMTSVKEVSQHAPIDIKAGQTAKPIQIKKVVDRLSFYIANSYGGLLCAHNIRNPDAWRSVRLILDGDKFTEAFREELAKANYSVVGNPDALFDDPSEWKAELLVAGVVTKLEVKLCWPKPFLGHHLETRGGTYIQVDWQVYSRLDRKVVYEVSTVGSYETETAAEGNNIKIPINAFSLAVRNLLADRRFHELVAAAAGQGVEGAGVGIRGM